jgi:hypothetical protein
MLPLRLSLIAAAAAFCLMSCGVSGNGLTAALADKDYNSLSTKLKKDMSEGDVAVTLGSPPDKADLITCTDPAGKPWQCRTWIYGGGKPKNNLRVVFYQADDSAWRVVTWDTF